MNQNATFHDFIYKMKKNVFPKTHLFLSGLMVLHWLGFAFITVAGHYFMNL